MVRIRTGAPLSSTLVTITGSDSGLISVNAEVKKGKFLNQRQDAKEGQEMSVTGVLHAIRELADVGPLLFHGPKVKLGDHLGNRKGSQPHASRHGF